MAQIKISPDTCLALWRKALEFELGIRVRYSTKNTTATVVVAMHTARTNANDPRLADLVLSPIGDDELYIYRRTVEVD